ncbi:conserved hypothetical protein [Histoplasma capsulatum G186AR]|uniref:Uncharacterized protein n=2 Tax=Ajellomyces capsulatus TaxID=5037 RepID=C0NDB0_AJECG|nr:uncharacterized protein HCBG_01106 [Histoplasma capsulatum G186AR]EEH11651.1 conserved hypothetical protein [Histoplasma capsulatum G186AR]KAG5302499.1 hypothetical protein I7I52_00165 [Histoplasma capsulatum]QSS72101.1 hypothetical protein I7I50_03166 [Histoplasma capsulatum G186AR]
MRVRAASALLWSCGFAIAFSHVIPHTRSASYDDDYPGPSYPVEAWSDDENSTTTRFDSLCDGCFGSIDISYVFDIHISSTQFACEEANVTLNQRKLDLVWHGNNGIGSGIFPANMTNGEQTHELSLNYLAFCISSPQSDGAQYTAQILTVTFKPTNQITENERTSGFAVSFNSVGTPRIYRLVASPIDLLDDSTFESWRDPLDPSNLPISIDKAVNSEYTLSEDLKRLHALKAEAHKLQEEIKFKEQEIRKHLLQDCKSMATRLKECANLSCFIRTSLEIVPDAFRLVKHQFGPLPSSLSDSPCRPLPSNPYKTHSSQATPPSNIPNPNVLTKPQSTPSLSSQVSTLPSHTTLIPTSLTNYHTHNYYNDLSNCHDLPEGYNAPNCRHVLYGHDTLIRHDIPTRGPSILLKSIAIILLITSLFIVLIKHCRNSPSWLRRRVDLAARREERRTRNAYLNAARRYRWRQWWNSRFRWGGRRNSVDLRHTQHGQQQHQRHNMLIRVDEGYESGSITSNNRTGVGDEGGGGEAIQAEILGFRRVLEFVGELIRPDYSYYSSDDTHNNNSSSDYSHLQGAGDDSAGDYQRDISQLPFPATAPSSVAPLTTTIYSPRTSTVLSIETDSSDTLDSLDPETATMFSG